MKLALAVALFISLPLSARTAVAHEWGGSHGRDSGHATEFDVDIVGPVRIGWGYSRLFRAQILSLSFEDEIWWHQLSDGAKLGVAFGLDGQRVLGDVPAPRGFLATGIGPSLLLRPDSGRGRPAVVVSGTAAPLWQSHAADSSLSGFGVSGRLELWPAHQSIVEAIECRRGTAQTYVLSGIHAWGLARYDWLGARGDSYAIGIGFDLGRNLLLPILGALLDGACAAR
jgi:hypothetical protein